MAEYAELTQPDRRTLHFTPLGLASGTLDPKDAVAFQSAVIADAVLADAVPEEIRSAFERLRDKHVRGVIDYGNFAEICNQVLTLHEPALRTRFVRYYQGREIPFAERDGTPALLRADRFDVVYGHVYATRGKHLVGRDGRVWFNGTLDGLLAWARNEGLLRGQRARHVELIIQWQRNLISHDGGGYRVETPVTSARKIRDLGEFINQLWGVPTPGGRLYPAPVTREVLALGSGPDGTRLLARAEGLSAGEDPAITWVLLRGVFGDDEVMDFDSRYQTTGIASEYLWGPGKASDALRWLDTNRPTPDQADPVDQLMLVRHHGDKLYMPQRPEIAAAMPPSDQTGRWYLLLADHPWAAFGCVRAIVGGDPGHRGKCGCATRRLGHGEWRRVQAKVMHMRPDLAASALPPDVQLVDEWRRSNRWVQVGEQAA